MANSFASDLKMVRVITNDPALERDIPLLGLQQGLDYNTQLPDQLEHFKIIAGNFRQAINQQDVEIWRLQEPAFGVGAVFLSEVTLNGQQGWQLNDIITMPAFRNQGLEQGMMQFIAFQAQSREKSFLLWECEEGNPAEKICHALHAKRRENLQSFRLTKEMISKIGHQPDEGQRGMNANAVFSKRFSIYRAMSYGINGYDIDPTQNWLGAQVEDVPLGNVDETIAGLAQQITAWQREQNISFVDLMLRTDNENHQALIRHYNAGQNTYSGSKVNSWELSGEAFAQAAVIGSKMQRPGL